MMALRNYRADAPVLERNAPLRSLPALPPVPGAPSPGRTPQQLPPTPVAATGGTGGNVGTGATSGTAPEWTPDFGNGGGLVIDQAPALIDDGRILDYGKFNEDGRVSGATEIEMRRLYNQQGMIWGATPAYLNSTQASSAKAKGWTANQYAIYLELNRLRAGELDKNGTAPPDPGPPQPGTWTPPKPTPTPTPIPTKQLPPLPRPITPAPQTSGINTAMVAVGAALGIYLISRLA